MYLIIGKKTWSNKNERSGNFLTTFPSRNTNSFLSEMMGYFTLISLINSRVNTNKISQSIKTFLNDFFNTHVWKSTVLKN